MIGKNRKCVIGIIGGIGSGKSEVAKQFARRGCAIVSGDELGHQALQEPAVKEQVIEKWGSSVCDAGGEIDRKKLGAVVFASPSSLKTLESLVFPYIEQGIDERIYEAQQDPKVRLIVLDAAVLLEAGWNQFCDWIVYVHAPRRQRLERLRQKRGWSEKEVVKRSKAQLSLTEKVTRSDFVIDNSGDLDLLTHQVEQLLAKPEVKRCRELPTSQ